MSRFTRKKRKFSWPGEEDLTRIRAEKCVICGITPVDAHHIKTKGAGGPDTYWNLLPCCRLHHSEIHQRGIITMWDAYRDLKKALERKGWAMVNGKLMNELNHVG